jgi:hypothetical protein
MWKLGLRAIPRKGIHKWDFLCSEDRQGEGRHEAKQADGERKTENFGGFEKRFGSHSVRSRGKTGCDFLYQDL